MSDYQENTALITSTLGNIEKMNLIEVETFLERLSAQRHISIFWYSFADIYHLAGLTEQHFLSFSERIEILKVMDEDATKAIAAIVGGIARTAIEDVVSRRL